VIIDWNVNQIISELQKCYWATTDPKMDGFTTWRCKQDLYRVQFALEDMLKNCPVYAPEQEWLEKREKEKMWTALKK
jgi:hypothetical protein